MNVAVGKLSATSTEQTSLYDLWEIKVWKAKYKE